VARVCHVLWQQRSFGVRAARRALAEPGAVAYGVKVNAANPGCVATDLNNRQRYRSVEEGAAIAVQLATLGPMGPTAGFFNDGTEATVGRHAW